MSSGKSFRPLTTREFETDEAADNEVQHIITTSEDEERKAREECEARQQAHEAFLKANAENANHILREWHKNNNKTSCAILGGRIKNIFRNKNKSNKSKSKRINKRIKKNKRYSRKYSRK
jgi:hypothetical protein